MQKQKRNGFSRSEFLALGAVVSVAGALLLPVLAQTANEERTKENARASTCPNNLKLIGLSLLLYQKDFDDTMPRAALHATSRSQNAPLGFYGWADAIMPYLKSEESFQCPSDKHEGQNDPMKPSYTDYWLNSNVAGVSAENIRRPSTLITVGDGDGGAPNSNARYHVNKLPKSWITTPNSPARRHLNQGCYAFADGHVERLDAKEVGTKAGDFYSEVSS